MYQLAHPYHYTDHRSSYQAGLMLPDPTWPPDVRAVVHYIHCHLFNEMLTVGELKRQCGIGDNNISGRFRYYVGMGIKQYIDDHRIRLAKRLLRRNQATILAIALTVGYPSHSALTKSFKRHVGCTPSVFREREAEKKDARP